LAMVRVAVARKMMAENFMADFGVLRFGGMKRKLSKC